MSNETFTIQTLIKFLQAAPSDDAKAFYCHSDRDNSIFIKTDKLPTVGDIIAKWEWPPQAKIINMSYMVGNGVDCEFSANWHSPWTVGKLKDIVSTESQNYPYVYVGSGGNRWKQCRPRMNEWLSHTGDKCPVPEGFVGQVMLRNGNVVNTVHISERNRWTENGSGGDIVQFMITGTAEGYQLKGD